MSLQITAGRNLIEINALHYICLLTYYSCYNTVYVMPKGPKLKTATMTLRIEPAVKAAAKLAARADRRSVASLIEVLILGHCREHKIKVQTDSRRSK